MRAFVIPIAIVGLAAPAAAQPPLWELDRSSSSLEFVGRQNDAEVSGSFESFDAEIRFAPDDLEGSSVRLDVDVASIAIGGGEREEIAKGSAWFHTEDFPRAVYTAQGFAADGDGYRADGTLALKGVDQPVPIMFDVVVDGETATATGTSELMRTAFNVGPAGAVFGVSVAPEVALRFAIVATRAE